MSRAVANLEAAKERAMKIRPRIGGFPFLAEILRRAGVTKNIWTLPSCQSLYLTSAGPVVQQMNPLIHGSAEVHPFDRESLIRALRKDQAGLGSFPEFLNEAWLAGVIRYEVDLLEREVTYFGAAGETYLEEYPDVDLQFPPAS